MLAWLSSFLGAALVISFLNLWMERQERIRLQKEYAELIKFALAKQDNAAYMTAYPLPNIDKVKQEEEQKIRKDILEWNNMMLRDSVVHGITEDEISRFKTYENSGIIS